MLEVDPDVGTGWSQSDELVDDLSVDEAGFEAGAALEDRSAGGGIGIAIPRAGLGGTAEDHATGVGIDRDEVGRVTGISLDEVGQPGVGDDDDVVTADGVNLAVGDEGACTEPGTVDDQR